MKPVARLQAARNLYKMPTLHWFHRKPLYYSLLLGLVLRLLTGAYVNTPIQEDDYAHVIRPALRALQNGEKIETNQTRLQIWPKIFFQLLRFAKSLGAEKTSSLLSIAYCLLGLFSLVTIWGVYKLGGNFLSNRFRNYLTLLSACYCLMPLMATRTFLGSYSLLTIPWAFHFLTKQRPMGLDWFWGGLLLGICVIIRFQIAFLAIAIFLFFIATSVSKKEKPFSIIAFSAGGFTSLILLGLLDLASDRDAFSTILAYVKENFETNVATSDYGEQPWFTFPLILSMIMIPPMSIQFLKKTFTLSPSIKILFKRFFYFVLIHSILCMVLPQNTFITSPWWGFAFLFFAIGTLKTVEHRILLLTMAIVIFTHVHSLIDNKLERFIIPIVPLFWVLTFITIEKYQNSLRRPFRLFWLINFLLIIPSFFINFQSNIIEPAMYLSDKPEPVFIKNIALWKQGYMGYDKKHPMQVNNIDQVIEKSKVYSKFYLLNFLELDENALIPKEHLKLAQNKIKCIQVKVFHPNFIEYLGILANEKMNHRRKKTFLYKCHVQN